MAKIEIRFRLAATIALGTLVAGAWMASGTSAGASERSLACSYGSATYKRCCNASYSSKPSLGWSARSKDIDACMSGGSAASKKSKSSKTSSDSKTDTPEPTKASDTKPAEVKPAETKVPEEAKKP
jgi:hypothetical protein